MTRSRAQSNPLLNPRSLWVKVTSQDLQALENGIDITVKAPPPGQPVIFGHSGGRAWTRKGYFLPGKGHHNEHVAYPFFEVRSTIHVDE